MHLSIKADDEPPVEIGDEERLRVAKQLICAAFKLRPKQSERDDLIASASLELANFMLAAVQSLLRTPAERSRAECFDAIREQHNAIHAHGLH